MLLSHYPDREMVSATMQWAQTMLGRVLKAQYRVEGVLGEGAMGVVFRGVNQAMEKVVAIKMMRKEAFDTPDAVERFTREARVWSQLNHPVITQVFDFGVQDGQLFIVMELVEGVDLSDVLKNEGPLDPLRAVQLIRQLAAGLEEAHRLGVIHRDIKPQNMKLLRYKPGGRIVLKVLDFGMAKQLGKKEQRLTAPGMLVGTPKYVAPEQVTENPVIDGRTDLYAAGVLFYELLTGDAPFLGTPHEVLFAHLGTPPKPLPENVPVIVSDVVMRLLRKRPDDRYPSASDLEHALEDCELALRSPMAYASSGAYLPVQTANGLAYVPAPLASAGTPQIPAVIAAAEHSGPRIVGVARPAPPAVPVALAVPAAAAVSSPRAPDPVSSPEGTPAAVPAKRNGGLVAFVVSALLLCLVIGGGAYHLKTSLAFQRTVSQWVPMYRVAQDDQVTRAMRDLQALSDARQWMTLLAQVAELDKLYSGTLLPEQQSVITVLRQKAALEQPMQEVYERLVTAATRPDPDEVMRLYRLISAQSIYASLAQPYHDVAVESFVTSRLVSAEALRTTGRCAEYTAALAGIASVVPTHPALREADQRPCDPALAAVPDAGVVLPDAASATQPH